MQNDKKEGTQFNCPISGTGMPDKKTKRKGAPSLGHIILEMFSCLIEKCQFSERNK